MRCKLFIILLPLSLLTCLTMAQKSARVMLSQMTHELIPIRQGTPVTHQAEFNRYCDSVKAIHDSPQYMGRILCENFPGLPYHNGKQNIETNFIVDAVFRMGDDYLMEKYGQHADMAILNFGGIRVGFPAGNLTYGHLFDALCFDNYVSVQKFTGEALMQAFDKFKLDGNDSVIEQPYSHLQITYHRENTQKEILIGGKPVDKHKIYRVVSLDFILGPSVGDRIFENVPRAGEFELVQPAEPLRDKIIPFLIPEKINLKPDDRVRVK